MAAKILVIDDDGHVRKLLKRILEQNDFEIHLAEDGMTGFEKAKKLIPDLIIIDVLMPKIDGIKTSQMIKNKESLKHIPIVLLSAIYADQNIPQAHRAYGDAFVSKPFDVKSFVPLLQNLLDSYK